MKACDATKIATLYRDLGIKLLTQHAQVCQTAAHGKGLLTGPMFSHLIANLVLRDVDEAMSAAFPMRYFRYVDDVVLVGSAAEVSTGRSQLAAMLTELGLELHENGTGKDFELASDDWLHGEGDFSGKDSYNWMLFVHDIKQFLISQPSSRANLVNRFAAEGFRIPLLDYSMQVSDARYQERFFNQLRRYPWLLKKIFRRATPNTLLISAQNLRAEFSNSLFKILDAGHDLDGYARKRVVTKIRYFAGRLLYLAKTEDLAKIAERLRRYPELAMLAEILHAVGTRDVTQLLRLGNNAAQSAAQPLKITPGVITCQIESWGSAERKSLAILRANGISVAGPADDELNRFALWNERGHELMSAGDPFIKEIACLHGISEHPRHPGILETALDHGEELAFDATTPIDTY